MSVRNLFTVSEANLYVTVLGFLESVYDRWGVYRAGDAASERWFDVVVLNFVKVVNDCRAIMLLAENGFYIQAGIVARSASDACTLMMHISFEGQAASLVRRWLEGKRVTHWNVINKINEHVEVKLDVAGYRRMRTRLDDFVHANFRALSLYPTQSPGATPMDDTCYRDLTFWKGLIHLYVVSCVLVVQQIAPDLQGEAALHLDKLLRVDQDI